MSTTENDQKTANFDIKRKRSVRTVISTICLWWIGIRLEAESWYYILLVLRLFFIFWNNISAQREIKRIKDELRQMVKKSSESQKKPSEELREETKAYIDEIIHH